MHLVELEEERARFLSMIAALRSMAETPETEDEEERANIEGELYASLSHMKNHVRPALLEMDRLLDEMPEDDEEGPNPIDCKFHRKQREALPPD